MTRDSKVVVSRVFVGVGWIMKGLQVGVMIEMKKVPSLHHRCPI
jgi:hypothetical protein